MSLFKPPKIWGFIQFLKWMEKHLAVCAQCVPSHQSVSSTVLQYLASNRITRITNWNLQLKTELTADFRNLMRIVVVGFVLRRWYYFALSNVCGRITHERWILKGLEGSTHDLSLLLSRNSPRNTGKPQEPTKIAVVQAQPRTRYLPNTSKERHCSYACHTYLR